MNYITSFHFPTNDTEADFIYPNPNNPYMKDQKYVYMTCFNSYYPFKIFPEKGLSELYFSEPITLLYGTNGSGKTTALNVIAEKISFLEMPYITKRLLWMPMLIYVLLRQILVFHKIVR